MTWHTVCVCVRWCEVVCWIQIFKPQTNMHAPGTHVSAVKAHLWPSSVVSTLPIVHDRVSGLFVVAKRSVRRSGKNVDAFVLRHVSVPQEIFARRIRAEKITQLDDDQKALVDSITAAAAAAAAATAAAAAAVGPAGPAGSAGQGGEDSEVIPDPDAPAEADDDPSSVAQDGDNALALQWGPVGVALAVNEMFTQRASFKVSLPRQPAQLFKKFIPPALLNDIVSASNAAHADLGVTQDEFLRFVGLIMLSATQSAGSKEDMWTKTSTKWVHKPPVQDVMTLRRFREIGSSLQISSLDTSTDRFAQVRKPVQDWNAHMGNILRPGAVTCLDESMVSFKTADHSFPGFTFCARKPHPEGNMYHTLCDADTRILFHIELQEGRDRPAHLPRPEYEEEYGTMGALMLRMTESLQGSGRVVVMDSAFSITSALVAMRKSGIHSTVVIKRKGAHWPRCFPGDDVLSHMEGKPVGDLHTAQGILDGATFNVFAVNHKKFTYINLATYGSSVLQSKTYTIENDDGTSFTYKRNQVLADHYGSRFLVDIHNRFRQGMAYSLERAWGSKSWIQRQLAFLLSLSLVNAFEAYNFMSKDDEEYPPMTYTQFFVRVMEELLVDDEMDRGVEPPRQVARLQEHELVKAPLHTGAKGVPNARMKYQQVQCKGSSGCTRRVREHCTCDPKLFLCPNCFARHFHDMHKD